MRSLNVILLWFLFYSSAKIQLAADQQHQLQLRVATDDNRPGVHYSTTKYQKHPQQLFQSRIVGGKDADAGEFPFMTGLYWSYSWPPSCGGSLIAPNLILSAAHCNSAYELVRIGSKWAESLDLESSPRMGVEARVVNRIKHPAYNTVGNAYDFAILELDKNIDTNLYPPINLNFDNMVPKSGGMLTTIGFGDLTYKGIRPDRLQKVEVPTTSHEECHAQYGNKIKLRTHLCAGYAQGGQDSCVGDSGGPLLEEISGVLTQVGVVSFGRGCAIPNYSGVYARVSGGANWIQRIICQKGNYDGGSLPKPSYCKYFTPQPTPTPTPLPTSRPTSRPTSAPTPQPTSAPTPQPTSATTPQPISAPTPQPISAPTPQSTSAPTPQSTPTPTPQPTLTPTSSPVYTLSSTVNLAVVPGTIPHIPPQKSLTTNTNENCIICNDKESSWMIEWNIDCASQEKPLARTCRNDNYWIIHKFCRLSCYNAGFGYDGDDCCNGNTNIIITNAPMVTQVSSPVQTSSQSIEKTTSDDQCIVCSDVNVPRLEAKGKGCSIMSKDILAKRCNEYKFWIKKKICQLTCYEAGYGYSGDVCCTSEIISPPLPVPSPIIPAPTPMPTKHCIICDDVGNPWMQNMEEQCEGSSFIERKCNRNEAWRKNKYCQATCYEAGYGYEGDECCTLKW